ncbi:hypothetical protein [Shinella granuli]|uniref:Uncharacterized protein n=1 Tax=Shinella granuli TaxID=323621 RepID=A0A4R2D684_SHIGR|nr:hypothetical protein [Shinella granuli]TCN47574.1 hypothetical protein EV665_10293 [Shinella granuli]
MKIDGSLYTAYAFSKPRAASEDSLYNETGGNGAGGNASARNVPTVAPTTSLSSSFANALWLTQAKLDRTEVEGDGLVAEFMELSRMTAVERLRKELLETMGLTEESLAQLPPETRSAIEEEIRRAIKEQLGVDETADGAEGQAAGAGREEAEG